jgi:hypothetical protein
MANQNIGLGYGIMCEPLTDQLDKQNFKYDFKKMSQFEEERNAINTLRFGSGLLTDSMVDKILQKLHKKIIAHVAKKNGLSIVPKNTVRKSRTTTKPL